MSYNCHCGKLATMAGVIYKDKSQKLMCFDCAWDWLKQTSKCPQCGKGIQDCIHGKKGTGLDRGIRLNGD